MNGRRAVTGLSLLCALVFCAVAAPSAFAFQGTTAFTCIPETGKGDFGDAHCVTAKANGGFQSKEIKVGEETKIEGTNAKTKNSTTESTSAKLTSSGGGVEVELLGTTVSSTGAFTNKVVGGQMIAEGPVTITYTSVKAIKPQNKAKEELCQVHSAGQPAGTIVAVAQGTTVVDAKGMYVNFKGNGAGGNFTVITFENLPGKVCPAPFGGNSFPITGTAALDAPGATLNSPSTVGTSTLKLGEGFAATLTSSETIRMDKEGGPEQNPIFLKTTAT